MREERRFTAKELTQVHKDWMIHFPEYGPFRKNGKLIKGGFDKLVGPLHIAVWLDTTRKTEYRPHFSVRCLLNSTHGAYLDTELRKYYYITTDRHFKKELYLESIKELKNIAPLPVEGPLKLSDIIKAYREQEYDIYVEDMETPALVSAWLGKVDLAMDLLEEFKIKYVQYHELLVERKCDEPEDHPTVWEKGMKKRILDREGLNENLQAEIQKHNLDQFPAYDIVVDC